jgi:hypothetical protein
MRTTTRSVEAMRPSADAMAARAAALFGGATASSRSTTTASAALPSAFSKRSGRSPGTNR